MAKRGKKYREVKEKAPREVVELPDAIEFLKSASKRNFDETVEMGIRLGIDPAKSEHAVRGTVGLPHGTGKAVRVLVFASGAAADAARNVGAESVGFEDMIEKVKAGWTDFDVAIATPDAMKEVRK
ncbi:MAG: 50S ribosomal protein L1, partial [Lentisphaerae bacterium]|nr:50S ribosomal protein L1 [Lentisphaerota bacterium]